MPTINYIIEVPVTIEYRDTKEGPELWTYTLPEPQEIYAIVDGEKDDICDAIGCQCGSGID